MHSATLCLLILLPAAEPAGSFRIVSDTPLADDKMAEIAVEVADALPVRVIVTASDKSHPDGSGNGVYSDGRFFADGKFTVRVPAGQTRIKLQSGPNHVPLEMTLDARAGRRLQVAAQLQRWYAPEEHGWYAGDNHVHAQHDAKATIKTGLAYTALQARANGLTYITEAGSAAAVSFADMDKLNTKTFLLRQAQEVRPGPFVGHLNTPGIRTPIPPERLDRALKRPLPVQGVAEVVRELGGVVIHTHPLTPPHLLHWMGAGEAWSDAVLGQGADLFDIDSRQTELFWFAILNLGRKLPCSSYTDCALGRPSTPSPGDRRVYCHARELTYPAIVEALRQGKTFASNGGPLFPFWTIDGHEPQSQPLPTQDQDRQASIEIRSLYPLRSAQLIRRGLVVHAFDVTGQQGDVRLKHALKETARSWYVLRVEDERGHWATTSPIYFEPPQPAKDAAASALILAIGNHTRFIQLRQDFFAHLIVTVAPNEVIDEVELLKDGEVLRAFKPAMGNQVAGKIPVTEIEGDYAPGWIWHPAPERGVHFQADWPVKETGWYSLRARTRGQRLLVSDAIHFDAKSPQSRALSAARLEGADTLLTLWGYGEEMPLGDIRLPFNGDHWWYPARSWWQIQARFGGQLQEVKGGGNTEAARLFRAGR